MISGIYTNELARVERGPEPYEDRYGYMIVDADAYCSSNAESVLARCREVMRAVLTQPEVPWPSVEQWRKVLPRWFVEAGGEESPGNMRAPTTTMRQMTFEELEKMPWPAAAWVNTFEDGRSWYWWDAEVVSPNHLRIKLAVEGHPWSEGPIRWLLIASGAMHVEFR